MRKIIGLILYVVSSAACSSSSPPPATADLSMKVSTALNGCTDDKFVDLSTSAANRTIAFGGNLGLAYSPACALVSAGQMVTFSGDFSTHPQSPGSTPSMLGSGSPNNPIPHTTSGSAPLSVTFAATGDFPYFCEFHFGSGMQGVVRVR